jgi:hypothetical protein
MYRDECECKQDVHLYGQRQCSANPGVGYYASLQ